MLKKLQVRVRTWLHRNDRVVWVRRQNSNLVPGLDCPWEDGDLIELYGRKGKLRGSGSISAELAHDLNIAFHWSKNFHA